MTIKSAVITFPGSNCDEDLAYALKRVAEFEVAQLWHKDRHDLSGFDLVALPGGFSYGDYLRSGAMAALSPVMEDVKAFAARGGWVLGICNGFQILCEVGLLPGALAKNTELKFICQDVELKVENKENAWLNRCAPSLTLPIAHGDGRYILPAEEQETLASNGQILLRYTQNPNGSDHDIAGITNPEGNVFGLMPHPERAADLRSGDGKSIFDSIRTTILGGKKK